ncbi:MAG: response regulator [Deltaproteobacteria bacterium]|nr:response regulator [Deltaproteobacteria bacterium]MBW2362195.1 response regulator [Deltaproteobacteria bacterium]
MEARRTILLADDAPMFRELGSLFLARTGRVVTADNGHQGLEVLRAEKPSVVVADLDMPRMDGAELCRRIKGDKETAAIPVILVTGTADGRERAVRAGADDVIVKPINRVTLIQAVKRFLQNQPIRGLPRAVVETPVHIVLPCEQQWGSLRNVSRGGTYVEAGAPMPPRTEVSLEFKLPDLETPLAPTAQVIWRRAGRNGQVPGMGLQFLSLDRESVERIDAFVYENAELPPAPLAAGTAGGS